MRIEQPWYQRNWTLHLEISKLFLLLLGKPTLIDGEVDGVCDFEQSFQSKGRVSFIVLFPTSKRLYQPLHFGLAEWTCQALVAVTTTTLGMNLLSQNVIQKLLERCLRRGSIQEELHSEGRGYVLREILLALVIVLEHDLFQLFKSRGDCCLRFQRVLFTFF